MSIERKLAAIMFTDIAGYTALSAKDETKALKLLDRQKQILTPIIEEFNGTLHKEMGDGLLFTFSTVTEAVKCGIKIQEQTKTNNDLNLRIGIHEGEITFKDGDALGDDVNVASRIEAFALSGGIAISSKVQQNISSLPEFETSYVGKPELKGVAQKVEVYCITSHGLPKADEIAPLNTKKSKNKFNIFTLTGAILTFIGILFWLVIGVFGVSFASKDTIPSVGILMMDNLGDKKDNFWVSGITGDLIIKVASSGNIRIPSYKEIASIAKDGSFENIAKKLNVKYILTSELYKTDTEFQLRSQLINTKTGVSEYANKWTETIENSSNIVNQLSAQLLKIILPKNKLEKEDTIDSDSYSLYLEGKSYAGDYEKYINISKEDLIKVQNMFYRSIALDSTNIDAHIQLARTFCFSSDASDANIAISILKNALSIANQISNKKLIGRIYRNLGLSYGLKINRHFSDTNYVHQNILNNYKKAAEVGKNNGDVYGYWLAQNNLVRTFFNLDSENSIDSVYFYNNQLLDYAKANNNYEIEASVYSSLSLFYLMSEFHHDKIKSKEYMDKALALGSYMSITDKIRCLRVGIWIETDIYKNFELNNKILFLSKQINDKIQIVESLYNLASNFQHPFSDFEKSEKLLRESLQYENVIHDFDSDKARILNILGKNYYFKGEFDNALKIYKESANLFPAAARFQYMKNKNLAITSFYVNDYEKAKLNFDIAINMMKSMIDDPSIFILSYFNEIRLENYSSTNLSVKNPFERLFGDKQKITMDDLEAFLFEIEISELHGLITQHDFYMVYYNMFQIYSSVGDLIKANRNLNKSHAEIMKLASKLKPKDRTRFLSKNHFVKMVLLEWNKLGDKS